MTTFITLTDNTGREFPINVDSIATVVHRSVNSDDGSALIVFTNGGKEIVQETVKQVMLSLSINATINAGEHALLRAGVVQLMKKMAERSDSDCSPGYKKWDVCRSELHDLLFPAGARHTAGVSEGGVTGPAA